MDRLHWEIYIRDEEGFSHFIEESVSFMHIYLGDVREAVAHSDEISKFGRVIYNESAWDTEKFKEIKEEITQPTHYDVIKEVLLRIEKYSCEKVDLGYLGRWRNPYQIAETRLPTGITFTYELLEDGLIKLHGNFFGPEHWFNIQCKPLFKTDPIVMKEPNGSWNMNPVGLISPKAEKATANRRAMFSLFTDFINQFTPLFSSLSLSQMFFTESTNTAYLVEPSAKTKAELLPIIFCFTQTPFSVFYSDSEEVSINAYKTTQVSGHKVYFEPKHFDFL